MKNYHNKRFPGESDSYREERNELLEAEINLRRQTEEVAALRRSLPNSAPVKEDYVFEEKDPTGNTGVQNFRSFLKMGKIHSLYIVLCLARKMKSPVHVVLQFWTE